MKTLAALFVRVAGVAKLSLWSWALKPDIDATLGVVSPAFKVSTLTPVDTDHLKCVISDHSCV